MDFLLSFFTLTLLKWSSYYKTRRMLESIAGCPIIYFFAFLVRQARWSVTYIDLIFNQFLLLFWAIDLN